MRRKRICLPVVTNFEAVGKCLNIRWQKLIRFVQVFIQNHLHSLTTAALVHFSSTRVGPTGLGKLAEKSSTGLC